MQEKKLQSEFDSHLVEKPSVTLVENETSEESARSEGAANSEISQSLETSAASEISLVSTTKQPPEIYENSNVSQPSIEIKSPASFLMMHVAPAARFLLISVLCVCVCYMLVPIEGEWISHNSYLRTAVLAAFIWNVIGAVLYAQIREKFARSMTVIIFAVPFATTWLWAIPALAILPTLMYYLPPTMK